MDNPHGNITVGAVTLPYPRIHHGWITPKNRIERNPFKAQLIAERFNSCLKLSVAANGLVA
ncbi:DUF1317 family protein [Yersinia entomophaga]|uniref:DUF1317 family protein n=1 Tax=Yersinia entomophaga TaxID=935293 RepID=UPI0009FE231F|nr:DUF1317 family protein [Yersinia entomophaga]